MIDGMRRWFFGQIAYPLAVRTRGEHAVFERLEKLRSLEAKSDPRLVEAVQQRALAEILSIASRVPHYSTMLSDRDWSTPELALQALREMPPLEKAMVQEERSRLESQEYTGRVIRKTTGGSTGRPVTIVKNSEAVAREMAASWLGYGWFGIGIGDPCVRFWGQPVSNIKRRLRYLAADAAMHRITLSAFGYTKADLRNYISTTQKFRPRYLYGYVSALEDLARTARDEGAHIPSLRAVVTTAEVLTEAQRIAITEGFGVPVQNEYGCGEVGPIAYQCPKGSLHLLPANQLVEIVRPDGEPAGRGEIGAVLITDLTNHAMPLIRYRVGDNAAFGGSCPCGRPFPTLLQVFGREYDFVEAADGRRYHGEFFMYIFEDLRQQAPDLAKFCVVQTSLDHLVVKVVSSAESADVSLKKVQEEFSRRLPHFRVDVELVDRLTRMPSGKMRIVESRISRTRAEG